MTRTTFRRAVAPRRLALAGMAVAAAGASTGAAAQARWGVDTSVSAGISTNPYFDANRSSVSATGTVDVRPSLVLQKPLTTLTLSGDASVSYYSQYGGTNESFSVNGAVDHRLSERTSLDGSLQYRNSIVGSFQDVRVPVGQPIIQNDLPVFVNDPALAGLGLRSQALQVGVGLTTTLSPHDRLSVNVSGSINRTGGLGFSDFNYLSPSVSYSRLISDGFNVGANMSVAFTDYVGTQIGDATVYQPQLTASRRLSSSLTLDVAAGAGIATVRNANLTDTSSTSFNGTATLCRRDLRWNACLSASRQTLPSAYQGLRTQTSATASVGYRMGARDNLSFSGSYSHAGAPVQQSVIGGARSGTVDYLTASGNFTHQFGRTFSGFATTGLNKSFNDGAFGRSTNYSAQLGLTYSFGRR